MSLIKNILKSITIFFVSTVFIFNTSCEKEDNSNSNEEFYVKYDFEKSVGIGRIYTIVVSYKDADGNIKQSETRNNFSTTIGPVKKGFQAGLNASDKYPQSEEYHLKLKLKISTSKNNGPFAEKVIDDSSKPRSSASIDYQVN